MADTENTQDPAASGVQPPVPEQDIGRPDTADASRQAAGAGAADAASVMQEFRRWLPDNLSTLPALLGLAGALAYGALNVASTVFYQGLGVTPSAVGLGYGELLARVAVIAAIVAATALVCALAITVAVHCVVRCTGIPSTRRRARLEVLAVGIVAILIADFLLSIPPPLELKPSWADVFALAIFDVLVAIGVLVGVVFVDAKFAEKCDIDLRYLMAAAGVWLLMAPLSFVAHAVEGADEVQHGRRQVESLFGAPFPWQVAVAEVTWKDRESQPQQARGCLLYLGSSGNVAVFYDPRSVERRSVHVPATDVIVEVYPERTSCR